MRRIFLILVFILLIHPVSHEQAFVITALPEHFQEPNQSFTLFLPVVGMQRGPTPCPNPIPGPIPCPIPNVPTPTDTSVPDTPTPISQDPPTETPTIIPTITQTPTKGAFPQISLSCPIEIRPSGAVVLHITVTAHEQIPIAANFSFEPTEVIGPVEKSLPPHGQLVVMFPGDIVGVAPGSLAGCENPSTCTAIYTLTDSNITSEIGKTVECEF